MKHEVDLKEDEPCFVFSHKGNLYGGIVNLQNPEESIKDLKLKLKQLQEKT